MKKFGFKLFFTIFVIFASLFVAFPWKDLWIDAPFSWDKYKLGLDLSWGIVLDYKVDLEEASKEEGYNYQKENDIIEGLKSIVDKRISSLNINDSVITSSSYGDERHIIVEIPLSAENSDENNENIKKAKEAIWKVVKIEFKERNRSISEEDYKEREAIWIKALEEAKASEYEFSVTWKKYQTTYEKVNFDSVTWEVNELKNAFWIDWELETGVYKDLIKTDEKFSYISMKDWNVVSLSWEWSWVLNIESIDESGDEKMVTISYIYVNAIPSDWKTAIDDEGRSLTDKQFKQAGVTYTQANQPQVQLIFNDEWKDVFGQLTTRLKGEQIAIFVGWEMITAPTVQAQILDWVAVITWNYTTQEASAMANDINTWVIPAPIYLTSENNIDSKLWANSLQKLIIAWGIGLFLIIAFLIYTYRLGGLIAWITLVSYTWIVLSIVKMNEAVLTLASIAGLVLSIWMAIDANILIFERIKDNLRKGYPTGKSTEDGFDSSWTAIWDTNITGLIIAIILYIFWINMIKGFGLMLAIWTVVSLFTVMYISRVLIMHFANNTNIKKECLVGKIKESE